MVDEKKLVEKHLDKLGYTLINTTPKKDKTYTLQALNYATSEYWFVDVGGYYLKKTGLIGRIKAFIKNEEVDVERKKLIKKADELGATPVIALVKNHPLKGVYTELRIVT